MYNWSFIEQHPMFLVYDYGVCITKNKNIQILFLFLLFCEICLFDNPLVQTTLKCCIALEKL